MVNVVYFENGDVIVCSRVERCLVTSMVVLVNPQGVTNSIFPKAITQSITVRPESIKQIYTGHLPNDG